MLVQLEPIRTASLRAADAVGLTALGEASPKPHERRSDEDSQAINGPLTPVTRGSLTVTRGHPAPQIRACDRPGRHRFPS